MRPANKMLYGVAADGAIVTIDLAAARRTRWPSSTRCCGQPDVRDRRLQSGSRQSCASWGTDGTNLRVDPDSGKVTKDGNLAFEEGDMHKGEKPAIVAAAYTYAYGKPEKTAMFDIDATIGGLIQQTKPNDGSLKAIGQARHRGRQDVRLRRRHHGDGTNTAWLAADNAIYKVALDSGKATMVGKISGVSEMVRDLAVLPQ